MNEPKHLLIRQIIAVPNINVSVFTAWQRLPAFIISAALVGCGSSGGDSGNASTSALSSEAASSNASSNTAASNTASSDAVSSTSSVSSDTQSSAAALDITNLIFEDTHGGCAQFVRGMFADVMDIQQQVAFDGQVDISLSGDNCVLTSNGIPNHDFNDSSAHFAGDVAAVTRAFTIAQAPAKAVNVTALSQRTWDAVLLNGVVVDLLSAGCYKPSDAMADENGNVPIGCQASSSWLLDPLGEGNNFGTDTHNAHTQPDGTYHYHGNPNALFDDNPGPSGSPVIGFAADGYPIYGTYFLDSATGTVRKALSGYSLKAGSRPSSASDPGGSYNGMYIDDWEYTASGDLDECNGMTVAGQYGYYVTESYPWVLKCHSGTPHASFMK